MLPELGGMLRYGITNYRLPKERLDDDIRAILKTGVQVKNGLKIGQDITIQELRQQYDVVLITIGASTDKKLGLENEDADGIISAVQFLRNVGKNAESTGIYRCRRESSCKRYLCDTSDGKLDQRWKSKYQTYR